MESENPIERELRKKQKKPVQPYAEAYSGEEASAESNSNYSVQPNNPECSQGEGEGLGADSWNPEEQKDEDVENEEAE